jgi:hypothetical protein
MKSHFLSVYGLYNKSDFLDLNNDIKENVEMDRLQEIKDKYMYWEYDFNLKKEDINWLIQQVEKVEQSEKENQLLYGRLNNIIALANKKIVE